MIMIFEIYLPCFDYFSNERLRLAFFLFDPPSRSSSIISSWAEEAN